MKAAQGDLAGALAELRASRRCARPPEDWIKKAEAQAAARRGAPRSPKSVGAPLKSATDLRHA